MAKGKSELRVRQKNMFPGAETTTNDDPPYWNNDNQSHTSEDEYRYRRLKRGVSEELLLGTQSRKHDRLHECAKDLYYDWVNEADLEVFRKALSDDPEDSFSESGVQMDRTERISSVPDFAPIQDRIKRNKKRDQDIVREGWAYHVSRWPLLNLIFTIIFFEFMGYVLVRQLVNVVEYISSWRGKRGALRLALREAKTFEEWKKHAIDLDNHLKLSDWKRNAQFAYYDSSLIRRILSELRELQANQDVEGIQAILEVCLRPNFSGTESHQLYSETYYGSKDLVEAYFEQVSKSITFMRETDKISMLEKAKFFKNVNKSLGATALCLSGGASFGFYHLGVVKALLDEGLMPRVISGTSAGALIASFICTRTDDELQELITPALADRISAINEPFSVWVARFLKTGARFDTVDWAAKSCFWTMGSTTFQEAYERTGRVLNVSVIPLDPHSPTKLLNHITTPHAVIFSAVLASAAVPGILNPVALLKKGKDGKLSPYTLQGKHKDGSLRVDIPLQALHLMYNVNFSIVSQVNPHIHLFHFAPRGAPGRPVTHRKGRGWRAGFLLSAAERFLKLELTKNFRVIRDLELLPDFAGQNWSSVFLQKFEGTVTIWPQSRLRDWSRILSDPSRDDLERMIKVGKRVTWPKIKMIENRMKLEREIFKGRKETSTILKTSDKKDALLDAKRPAEAGITTKSQVPDTDMPSGVSTPEQRKSNILKKLGLQGDGYEGDFSGDGFSRGLQRRLSMGNLQRGPRVRGPVEDVFGSDSMEEESDAQYQT